MKKIWEYVQKHRLITEGDQVIAGVSGGADSVCLLFVLLELKQYVDFSIRAVHINHQLRGKEALRDQQYVENLCKKLSIPLKIVSVPVSDVAKKEKMGIEEAGRKVRYQVFEEYAREAGGAKIALAHHQNDLAETMIYHLARGTDLAGLAGIRPKRGIYIRPLLCMNRREVEEYLQKNKIGYVTDSSNLEDHYMRNRIRHHVVEYLEREVNDKTAAHMSETAESMGEIYEYLFAESVKKLDQYSYMEHGGIFLQQALFSEPKVLCCYALREAVFRMCGTLKDITRDHVSQIFFLADRRVGKEVHLPYDLTAKKEYAGVWIGKKEQSSKSGEILQEENEKLLLEPVLSGQSPFQRNWNGYEILCRVELWKSQEIPEKKYTKWFDYDKIKSALEIRYRQSGDWITIHQQGGRKKIKDYFINEKVPREERDHIPLLCCEQEIIWIVGYRISEAYKVTEDTKNILKIQIRGGICHE